MHPPLPRPHRRFALLCACAALVLPHAPAVRAAEFVHTFTYGGTNQTNRVFHDDAIPAGQLRGAIVAFNYGGGEQAYTLPIWRNFARDRSLALVLLISQDSFGGPSVRANTNDGMSVLNNTLTAAATALGRPELASSSLPLVFAGVSRGGTSGAINFGWAYGTNRTVACLAYHGNSFNYLPSFASAAASNIPVLYTIAQNDSGLFRQPDIENAVRTTNFIANVGVTVGARPTHGAFWTTAMQYGSSHASLGDDTYPLQWLGRVWDARVNATNSALVPISLSSSFAGSYTLSNPATTSAFFSAPVTNAFVRKDGNVWLPPGGGADWIAENTRPATNDPVGLDTAWNPVFTAPDNIINRRFTNSGTLTFSGTGLIRLDNGSAGNPNLFEMGGGTVALRNGVTLRNGGLQGGVWTNHSASLDIGASSTLDMWDGNAVRVDALTGAGTVTIGLNPGTNWAGVRTLTVGVNGGSGSFAGILRGHPATNGGTLALVKTGAGTQTLSSSNSFAGGTTVTGGTLVVTNAGTLGSGPLAVSSNAACFLGNPAGAVADTAAVTIDASGRLDLAAGVTERVAVLSIGGTAMAGGVWNSARDPVRFSGGGSLFVATPGATARQDWRLANFGTNANTGNAADTADPDRDGLPNLVEFAIASPPLTPGPSLGTLNQSATPVFHYRRSHLAAVDGVSFIVEWSESLAGGWRTNGVTQSPVAGSDDGFSTAWTASLPAVSSGSRFARLRIVVGP